MIQKLKKVVICLAAGAAFMATPIASASANSVTWNGGIFGWSLGVNGANVTATTQFSRSIRLVTTVQIQNNATGAFIAQGTVDSTNTIAQIMRTGLATGRAAFGAHEARGDNSNRSSYFSLALKNGKAVELALLSFSIFL
ncbi:MAG: hypothetical protein FWF59_04130 [Turicibacter sp.]|nr:hypothetical protein [Turicibacter sp.]